MLKIKEGVHVWRTRSQCQQPARDVEGDHPRRSGEAEPQNLSRPGLCMHVEQEQGPDPVQLRQAELQPDTASGARIQPTTGRRSAGSICGFAMVAQAAVEGAGPDQEIHPENEEGEMIDGKTN